MAEPDQLTLDAPMFPGRVVRRRPLIAAAGAESGSDGMRIRAVSQSRSAGS